MSLIGTNRLLGVGLRAPVHGDQGFRLKAQSAQILISRFLRAAIVLKAYQLIREPSRLFCFFIQIAFPEWKPIQCMK
jgi:hypothetical protein